MAQITLTPQTLKTKPQATIIVMRNRLFYINCWNHMLLNGTDQCTDASGMVQYKAEVANILKKKYQYQVGTRLK